VSHCAQRNLSKEALSTQNDLVYL